MLYVLVVWITCSLYCFIELLAWKIEASEDAVNEVLYLFEDLGEEITLDSHIITKIVMNPYTVIKGFLCSFFFWFIHATLSIFDSLEYRESFIFELHKVIRKNLITLALSEVENKQTRREIIEKIKEVYQYDDE
jgi:hypothetical protein